MGAIDLAKTGKTEVKDTKVKEKDAAMEIAETPKLKFPKADGQISPLDSIYIEPTLDIKGNSPVTDKQGNITPKKKVI